MSCQKCGVVITEGDKFCRRCGSPLQVESVACPGCKMPASPGASFCPGCGYPLRARQGRTPQPVPQRAIPTDLKDMVAGEVVLRDTGRFPITCARGVVGSVNGRLYLTSRRLVFKAWKLQGYRGVHVTGLHVPNPADASGSKEYVSIPLVEVMGVTGGWTTLTVKTVTGEYLFGGMHGTDEWVEATRAAKESLMSRMASHEPS